MPLFKLPGIHVPHHKNTDEMKAVRMPIPKEVILQMNMHIGAFAKPIVNVGDHVLVGQKIAEAGGYISAPVHSSVSGVVKKLKMFLNPMEHMCLLFLLKQMVYKKYLKMLKS